MKKRLLALFMITALAFSTAACSSRSAESDSGEGTSTEGSASTENGQNMETDTNLNEKTEQQEDLTLAQRVSDSEDHYIFELRDDVTREKVYYRTRYGIEIAADLYRPADFDETKSYAGIVIGPPFGGVKEQGPRSLCE